MERLKKPLPLYPFLFVLWSVSEATLWARLTEIRASYWRLWVVVPLVFAVLLAALYWKARDRRRAAFAAFVAMIPLLAFGRFYEVAERLVGSAPSGAAMALGVAMCGLYVVAGVMYLRRERRSLPVVSQFLDVVTLTLLLVTCYLQVSRNYGYLRPLIEVPPRAAQQGSAAVRPPDIYYIIIDGYARSDVLRDQYGYDNAALTAALEEQGFYVAAESRCNYIQTALSVASSLNMRYLDDLAGALGPTSADRRPLSYLIQHSAVRQFLEGQGYATVALPSAVVWADLRDADYYRPLPTAGLTLPEGRLLDITVLRLVRGLVPEVDRLAREWTYAQQRSDVFAALDALPEAARALPGRPKFVFAHITSPHPPFVLDAEGRPLTPTYPFRLGDADHNPLGPAAYAAGYTGQVAYLDRTLPEVLRAIVAASEVPPIIVVQADHGPGQRLSWSEPTDEGLAERLPILNAILLPGGAGPLYPRITPVNTFRVVLDLTFGTGLGLLEDRGFYSPWSNPYDLTPAG